MPSVNGLGSGQINQTPNVSLRNPVGNVGDKTVQENHPPETGDTITSSNAQAMMTSARTTKPRSISRQSGNVMSGKHTGFNHIKGFFQAFKDTVSAEKQENSEVEKHESKTQVEQKTTEQTQSSSSVENTNQTEEKGLLKSFKEFSSKISQKLDALIAGAKELKDSAKAKILGYDKAINEKFGEALNTKLFTFEEKKVLVNFIKRSSTETDNLDNVIGYETNVLRNALLKALPEKISDEQDKQAFEGLKQHGGGAYKDNVLRFDPLNSGSTATHDNIKKTTLKLCDLYKKHVDHDAFPSKTIEIKPEEDVLSLEDFEVGLENLENDPTLTPEEKQDIRTRVDALSPERKTRGLYSLMNTKILEKYDFELNDIKYNKIGVKYKNKAFYITSYKSNEVGQKDLYAKLKNANDLQGVCNILGLSHDEINEVLNLESKTLENFADDAQKIEKTSQNNPKSSVKTSKTQSHKPTQDKPPVKLQTSVQAPKAQTQVLTPRQTELRNTYCGWLYQNWNTGASGIIAALNANCPSEEQFTEFATFLQDQNNLNLNAIKTKVSQLTGQKIP